MFSTLEDLSVLRATQWSHSDHAHVDVADPLWNANGQAPYYSDDSVQWANMFGVDGSFGWGGTHDWEPPEGAFTTQARYGA